MAHRIIKAVAILAAASAVAGPAAAQHRHSSSVRRAATSDHLYYNISEDPQALELLALSDSGKVGKYTMIDVVDVSKSPQVMLGSKWRIDCPAEQMTIVESTRVVPGRDVQQSQVTTPVVSARASAKSFRIYQLACSGKGDLVERRMYHGELPDIVSRFWAQ